MITIYGKPNCQSCKDAVGLCEDSGIKFKYVSLGVEYDISDFYSVAPRSWRSFPMISFNGEFMGGLTDLRVYLSGLKT